MTVFYNCKICQQVHRSPIVFTDKKSFDSSSLLNNTFECPINKKSTNYSKGDMFWREEIENLVRCIQSGQADVIATGSVISYLGNPISIIFGSPNEVPLTIIFAFKDEVEKQGMGIESEIIDRLTLKLILKNFNNNLGSGSSKPIPIGGYKNRKLYVQYRVYALSGSVDKLLHYTLYLAEEDQSNG